MKFDGLKLNGILYTVPEPVVHAFRKIVGRTDSNDETNPEFDDPSISPYHEQGGVKKSNKRDELKKMLRTGSDYKRDAGYKIEKNNQYFYVRKGSFYYPFRMSSKEKAEKFIKELELTGKDFDRLSTKRDSLKSMLRGDASREEVKNYRSNPEKFSTALSKSSKNQLTPEEVMWVKDKLTEKGKSGHIVFANWKWSDIKSEIKDSVRDSLRGDNGKIEILYENPRQLKLVRRAEMLYNKEIDWVYYILFKGKKLASYESEQEAFKALENHPDYL